MNFDPPIPLPVDRDENIPREAAEFWETYIANNGEWVSWLEWDHIKILCKHCLERLPVEMVKRKLLNERIFTRLVNDHLD